MKQEDVTFIRQQRSHNRPDIQRLLSLLIESEAMRKKAEFQQWHKTFTSFLTTRTNCRHAIAGNCVEEHDWSDADWIANEKKEWGI